MHRNPDRLLQFSFYLQNNLCFLKNINNFANASHLFENNPNSEIKFNPFDFQEYFNNKIDKDKFKKTNRPKDLIKSN